MQEVDVVISGGDPVGFLIAYCLERYGVSTFIAEQDNKLQQANYGRAVMLAPRSLDVLEQPNIEECLGQMGFVGRGQATYKDGEWTNRVTHASSNITDTYLDFVLLICQMHIEETSCKGYQSYSHRSVQFDLNRRLADTQQQRHERLYHGLIDWRFCFLAESCKTTQMASL